MAAGKGDPEMVELLLAHSADPGVANHEGETALDLAKGKKVRELLREAARRVQPSPSPS